MRPVALTIAGSEATGSAGAQADLKTFHQLGVFGAAALTCIVSIDPQNDWDHRFVPMEPQVIADQIQANVANHDVAAVKIGMLGVVPTIEVVAEALIANTFPHVVLDPVLFCKGVSGNDFDFTRAIDEALKSEVLPRASLVTPNHFETLSLAGVGEIRTVAELADAARRIHDTYGVTVLAKGGTTVEGEDAVDVFYDGAELVELRSPKVGKERVTGAGCTLAAAVTGQLALGSTELEAARVAKDLVTSAIAHRQRVAFPFPAAYQGEYARP
ncbi:MAG: bifunctional hydroxymethylpyrimidine kinase/phosphomethylpyrimidine kinase [Brachybacterium sp.]|nr:bifunctional hydroxymethylpyrimidine kinase/phosphomethylpyrimidine kinase [Brachybacterium sp.]